MQAGGLRLAAARCLGGFVQARFSSKITTGGMKGKIQRGGRGGPVSKKYGWKEMPGAIVCTGDTIYKTQISGVGVDEDDDEMPFVLYPGLNTVRDAIGRIRATVDGVVRVSKLPGTEGTGEKVFLWVDPHWDEFMAKERERHRYRSLGMEFAIDEVEARSVKNPRWTRQEDMEQELPSWPYNPAWDLPPEERSYQKQPNFTHHKTAKTERQLYENADEEMFYSRMPNHTRHYRFGGVHYEYKGVAKKMKPVGVVPFARNTWHQPTASSIPALYAQRHDRRAAAKDRLQVDNVSHVWGTFWEKRRFRRPVYEIIPAVVDVGKRTQLQVYRVSDMGWSRASWVHYARTPV
ncbi:hypothetical protein DIPPA_27092 [Diplonema papillatum]|nr:hypothetical protein DIPPA_27092 [Diplonema papillatum]